MMEGTKPQHTAWTTGREVSRGKEGRERSHGASMGGRRAGGEKDGRRGRREAGEGREGKACSEGQQVDEDLGAGDGEDERQTWGLVQAASQSGQLRESSVA